MHFDRIIATLVNPKALKHWKRFKKHYWTRVKRKNQKPFNAQWNTIKHQKAKKRFEVTSMM